MLPISCSVFKQARLANLTLLTARKFSENFYKSVTVTSDPKERLKGVSYNQSAIDIAAAKKSGRLKPSTILYSGKSSNDSHILRTAEYLQRELPIRISHRIVAIQGLPYNVVTNPIILQVLEMYVNAFEVLTEFPQIENMVDEAKYSELLRNLLEQHRDVVTMLAEGFSECRKHIKDEETIRLFLDRTLKSRLGIRILCEHHLALRNEKPNHVGIFKLNFSPGQFIEKRGEIVRAICDDKYGRSPAVKVEGHVNATFPYIPPPLDYILVELLKNALRATVEYHVDSMDEHLPPVKVTIANNDVDFIIRISDRGGGVPHHIVKKIWDYNFTTEGHSNDSRVINRGLFAEFVDPRSSGGVTPSKMHGYGFGLPMSRAYVEFLGGTLTIETMQGRGTEVYLRLRHIEDKHESFRI